jgi:hypothetical protein
MIETIYQIDFIDGLTGGATRLLSQGDLVGDDLEFPVAQKVHEFDSLGMDWGGALGMGGARRAFTWTRQQEHTSLAEAAGFCIRHPASMPLRRAGKLLITISGGEVWEMEDAVISAAATRMDSEGLFATRTSYQASCGRSLPISGLDHYAGMPTGWILETHGTAARTHSAS